MPRERSKKSCHTESVEQETSFSIGDAHETPTALPLKWRCIGRKVRIFWEKEQEWNVGRILQYDPVRDEHEVFYFDAHCTKWIKILSQIALIGVDIVWSKLGSFNWWPAQVYDPTLRCLSSKCLPPAPSGGNMYVVFFGDDSQAWVRESFICPYASNMHYAAHGEKKGAHKLRASIKEAHEENNKIFSISSPKSIIEKYWLHTFKIQKPETWVGKKIAVTHPNSSTMCIATVKMYSASTGLHLCAYSEPADLRSNWIRLENAGLRLLSTESDSTTSLENVNHENLPSRLGPRKLRNRVTKPPSNDNLTTCRSIQRIEHHCWNCGKPDNESTVTCHLCKFNVHSYCIDPGIKSEINADHESKLKSQESEVKVEVDSTKTLKTELWCCKMCKMCDGCGKVDSVVGTVKEFQCADIHVGYKIVSPLQKISPWEMHLNLPGCENRPWKVQEQSKDKIGLCQSCELKYINGNYCLMCDVTWRDECEEEAASDQDMKSMQCCKCAQWVHARCDGVHTDEEFQKIADDMHPLWSAPFDYVCPCCRSVYHRKALRSLVDADKNCWFFHPVTVEQAPTYLYKISRPMSLSVIAGVIARGGYRNSQEMRENCELIAENAMIFNMRDDPIHKAAKEFFQACNAIWKALEKEGIYTQPSECGLRIYERYMSNKRKFPIKTAQEIQAFSSPIEIEMNTTYSVGNLVKCPDPIELAGPDKPPASFWIASTDLHSNMWMDLCLFCGTSGDARRLLCCRDCGEVYHPWCLGVPEMTMDAVARASWQCYNCKACEICCQVTINDSTRLLLCERCDRAFHTTCVHPRIQLPTENKFICGQCVDCTVCGTPPNTFNHSTDSDRCLECMTLSDDELQQNSSGELERRKALLSWEKKTCQNRTEDTQLKTASQWDCGDIGTQFSGKCPCCLTHSAEPAKPDEALRCDSCRLYVHVSCCKEAKQAIKGRKLAMKQTTKIILNVHTATDNGNDQMSMKLLDNIDYFCTACLGKESLSQSVKNIKKLRAERSPNRIRRNQNGGESIMDDGISTTSTLECPDISAGPANAMCPPLPKAPKKHSLGEHRSSSHLGVNLAARKMIEKVANIQKRRLELYQKSTSEQEKKQHADFLIHQAEWKNREYRRKDYEIILCTALNRLIILGDNPNEAIVGSNKVPIQTQKRASRFLRMMRVHGCSRAKQLLCYLISNGYKIDPPRSRTNSYISLYPYSLKFQKSSKLSYKFSISICTIVRFALCAKAFLEVTNVELKLDSITSMEHFPLKCEKIDKISVTSSLSTDKSSIASTKEEFMTAKNSITTLIRPSIVISRNEILYGSAEMDAYKSKLEHLAGQIRVQMKTHVDEQPKQLDIGKIKNTKDIVRNAADVPCHIEADLSTINSVLKGHGNYAKKRIETLGINTPRALTGWEDNERFHSFQAEFEDWTDTRSCIMCHDTGDYTIGGALLPLDNSTWIHTYCAAWSGGVVVSPNHPGHLLNVYPARSNSRGTCCSLCSDRGATLRCYHQKCTQTFHLPCAVFAGAALCRDRRVLCAAHINDSCIPHTKEELMQMPEMFYEIERRKLQTGSSCRDMVLRAGALLIVNVGEAVERPGWFSKTHVFPLGFKSIRIYWSRVNPMLRTPYVCEIIDSKNIEHCIPDTSHPEKSYDGILFRITSLEEPETTVILETSMESAYRELLAQVNRARDVLRQKDPWFLKERKSFVTYGLNGPQFFGVGFQMIRKIIEAMPVSIGAAARPVKLRNNHSKEVDQDTSSQDGRGRKRKLSDCSSDNSAKYNFCIELPSKKAIDAWHLKRVHNLTNEEDISCSCARVEPHRDLATRAKATRISRTIMKALEEPDGFIHDASIHSTRGSKSTNRSCPAINSHASQYKSLLEKAQRNLIVRKSNIHGWGLFTDQPFARDEMIIEYSGEVISKVESDIREKRYEELGMGSCYLFALDPTNIVDATCAGGPARFINHCCDPNAYARVIEVEKELKLVIFAKRNLMIGEEITYDYQFPYEDDRIPCHCGAIKCHGYMN